MQTKDLRRSTVAIASVAAAAALFVAAPVPADALTASAEPTVALASDQGPSLAARAIVIGSIETEDCTYTLVLDWDGFHIEVTCVSIS